MRDKAEGAGEAVHRLPGGGKDGNNAQGWTEVKAEARRGRKGWCAGVEGRYKGWWVLAVSA